MTRALISRQSQPANTRDQARPNHLVSHAVPVLARASRTPDTSLPVSLQSFDQDGTEGVSGFNSSLQVQRKCASCEEDEKLRRKCSHCEEEEKNQLHRKETRSGPQIAPPIVHEVLRSQGQPLDGGTRSFMESRFGHDFSRVRVHTSAHAAQSARAVNALAYTVGSSIVFDSRQYAPETKRGRELLAHELTHVVAQAGVSTGTPSNSLAIGPSNDAHEREADRMSQHIAAEAPALGGKAGGNSRAISRSFPRPPATGARLQRQLAVPGNIELVSGAYVGDLAGAGDNVREDVLVVMDRLLILGAISGADYGTERAVVLGLPAASAVPQASIPKTIGAVKAVQDPSLTMLAGIMAFGLPVTADMGTGKANQTSDILKLQDKLLTYGSITTVDYNVEHTMVTGWALASVPDILIPKTIQAIVNAKKSFVAGEIRRDLFTGTRAVNPTQHAEIEHILNPTTMLIPAAPPPIGVPAPPPVVAPPPALTGAGPGGAFEHDVLDYLKKNIGGWAKQFNNLKATPGQPSFPIASANNIAKAAQGEVEHYFAPYIKNAGRGAADVYHPEAYSLISKLGDESTRPVNDATRRGWLSGYFETLRAPNCFSAPCGQEILDAHHFFGARDSAELDRVTNVYLSSAANVKDMDDTIHSWPAEAGSGTVFIQPYQVNSTAKQKRENRWDLFTTLIHEMMHVVTHPNYAAAADTIGGTGRKILIEGFAEVMRTELWSGPGKLSTRVGNPEMAPLRQQVEGAALPYDPNVVKDHGYYDQLADATQINAKVGHQNAKAAFFLGQVELMGIGAGTSTESGGAIPANIAGFTATDSKDAEIVVAQAGDTLASVQARTGAGPGGVLDEATGTPIMPAAPIAAGKRLKVPGIRWVAAVKNNTLASVAEQNEVSIAALAVANGLPANSPGTTPLIPPRRILIPIHLDLP